MPTNCSAKDNSAAEPTRLLPGLRSLVAAIPPASLATQIEISAEQIMLGGRPVQNFAADLRGDAKILDHRPAGVSRAGDHPRGSQRRDRAARSIGKFQGSGQRQLVRSEYACGLAAGSRRNRLSQSKAAARERQSERGAGSTRDRRTESRDRRRHAGRARCSLESDGRRGLAHRGSAESGSSRSRCRDGVHRVRLRDRKPNGRTRRSYLWTSAAPYPRARSCVHSWRS